MKRAAGQAWMILGAILHQSARVFLTLFTVLFVALGLLAFRLSLGPIGVPYVTGWLATAVSGQGISIHVGKAALAWGGYKKGGGTPLYLQLARITASNAEGVELAAVPDARLVFLPSALLGGGAPILVNSADAVFAGSNVKISLAAAIRLRAGFRLGRADLYVTLGPGQLGQPGTSVPVTGGAFTLHVTPETISLVNGELDLAASGTSAPVLVFSGGGKRDQDWHGDLLLKADKVQAADLPAYWPPALVVQTRNWVTRNITAGTGANAAFDFALAAPRDLSSLALVNVTGGFTGTGLTLKWIPGAVPITALNATLRYVDGDNILINATDARLGGMVIGPSTMKITGVSHKDQIGTLQVALTGRLEAAIAVLNARPLALLAQAPPELGKAAGDTVVNVAATIPFKQNLHLAETTLAIAAVLRNVVVPTPLSGVAFSGGMLQLNATQSGLTVAGPILFAGQKADVSAAADFTAAPSLRNFRMKTVLGPALLTRLGLDVETPGTDIPAGTVPLLVQVKPDKAGQEQASVAADLTAATLGVSVLGWAKPAGRKGSLSLSGVLTGDRFGGVTSLQADGPDLSIHGQAENGRLHFSDVRIGRTEAQGNVTPPAHAGLPWEADFSGSFLDVRVILNNPKVKGAPPPAAATPAEGPPSGPLWQASLRFKRLTLAAEPAPGLAYFRFDGSGQGERWLEGAAAVTDLSGGSVTLTAGPGGTGYRRAVRLEAANGGNLLRALGAFDDIMNGALVLNAEYGGGPVTGIARLTDFRLLQAPAIGKILQSLTIYGAAEAASGPGLQFDRLVAPFSISNQVLTLADARAYSASLGFTASGTIGLADGDTDVLATIIPAYAVNSLPGKIPLIGKLFSAEKGGGLFSVRARITGQLVNPKVEINPLSVLTPGVLRDVFGTAKK